MADLLRVNLGSSTSRMLNYPEQWVNVDIRSDVGADIVADLRQDNPFTPGSVREIYCCHALEHLAAAYAYRLVWRMAEWLVPGGILWLAVPDFTSIVTHYVLGEYATELYQLISGHGTHHSHWTRAHLALLLRACGFEILRDHFDPMSSSPDSGQPDSSRRLSVRFVCQRTSGPLPEHEPHCILVPTRDDPHRQEDIAQMFGWISEIERRRGAALQDILRQAQESRSCS